ncbi:MAG TPA: hydantoinase/oxoprolinase family protein [Desulfitobacteriaceae bacterium]|nr:hydantoinase/oxoprolinase family protein [Desulfitobacteriaceae bacterium]
MDKGDLGETVLLIGVDTGGTFTDFICKKGEEWEVLKILSTPNDPAVAVVKGITLLADNNTGRVVHGSTVATNALLEAKWVKTAFISNRGFKDIMEIGRQNRRRLYELNYMKDLPIVAPEATFGIKGRINADGLELESFDEIQARDTAKLISRSGVQSVAVCLLFSFLNPTHELLMGQILEQEGLDVSLSHQILAEFREFERASTTVINAAVLPVMKAYLQRIAAELPGQNLAVMQSNGGQISVATAVREPVRTILSGPAGGVAGAAAIARKAGYTQLITFDMGGTSTDVALLNGQLPLSTESVIGGFPVKIPMLDIHTVGAGGGSIARIDSGRALQVGPESAGAEPGPVCYGKGEEITVTDANLFLGRLLPEYFLGGKMKLDKERLDKRIRIMATDLGLSPMELAEGICTIANTIMARAIRVISVERGYDPRDFTLFAYGGAGAMHAVFLAESIGIPRVMVPKNPGILSALGMLMTDVIKDYSLTVMLKDADDLPVLRRYYQNMEIRARADLQAEGFSENKVNIELYLDMRYQGQSHEIMLAFTEDYLHDFHRCHKKRYGYSSPEQKTEIVNIRLRAKGISADISLSESAYAGTNAAKEALLGERQIIFEQQSYQAKIYDRDQLKYGNSITGPALVAEYSSTVVLPPGTKAEVDKYGNLIIEIGAGGNDES